MAHSGLHLVANGLHTVAKVDKVAKECKKVAPRNQKATILSL